MGFLYGWGRQSWSSGPWGEPAALAVTGVQAAGALGSSSVSIKTTEAVTGLGISSSIGTVTVGSEVTISATGVQGAGALGSATVRTQRFVVVTGVEAVGSLGEIGKGVSFVVTGVSAQGLITTPNVWSVIDTGQDANWVPIAA